MSINFLEQKRLIFAKEQAERKDKMESYHSLTKKVPAFIQNNGLLYTLAYLEEDEIKKGKKKNAEIKLSVFEDIWKWHCQTERNQHKLMPEVPKDEFLNVILQKDDSSLRAITLETLALMKCLRRFVKEDEQ